VSRPTDDALAQLRARIARQTAEANAGAAPPDPETVSQLAAIFAGPRLRRARRAARAATRAAAARRDGP
jgi:hypothetical protein